MRGVLGRVLDPAEGPRVAMQLLDLVYAAKGEPCRTPGGVRRQAARLVGVLEQGQVRVDFPRQVAIRPPQAKQMEQAIEEATHGCTGLPSGD